MKTNTKTPADALDACIDKSVLTLQWNPQDGDKADVADVLARVLDESQRARTVKKLSDIMPSIKTATQLLVEKFDTQEL